MKNYKILFFVIFSVFCNAQKFTIDTLLTDKISIRAIQLWDGKVWYSGTDSKFGYVDIKNKSDKKQIKLSDKKLQFRTLAQNNNAFYLANIESPAIFFRIDKKTLEYEIVKIDSAKNSFYDAIHFNKDIFYAFSDPEEDLEFKMPRFFEKDNIFRFNLQTADDFLLDKGEAAFAASNTNIASSGDFVWLATGGNSSRIFRLDIKNDHWKVFETPFVQGTSSQGIYSIDFYDNNFGIAVGGDYTKQADNFNNIATTNDSGETWQVQARGQNAGYMTCVKFRPKTKGKELVAVGDQHISFSSDFGKTWTKISDEKNLYACEWLDKNTLILAGKDRIVKLSFQ
ncbi:MAG: glycosyl hydrolase [Chryseobacterium sp.]|nr:MAG: glycosyl hydrolase [Chryseobacterium sp.]